MADLLDELSARWPGVDLGSLRAGVQVLPEDKRYVIGQPLMFPVQAGDIFLWTHFEKKMTK